MATHDRAIRASPWGRVAFFGAWALTVGLATARLVGVAVPGWAALASLAVLLGVAALGVFVHRAGVFARPLLAASGARPLVAITFDDGPDPTHTRPLLDLLEAGGHRGTFFLIGARAEAHPEVVREIAQRGHELGNHSWDHSWATPLSPPGRLATALQRASAALARLGGERPRWFRPPVGLISPPVAAASRRAGLELVGWSATARDGSPSTTVEQAMARLRAGLRPGAILVLHDAPRGPVRTPIAPEVLRQLLVLLDERGLRSVTLAQLLDEDVAPQAQRAGIGGASTSPDEKGDRGDREIGEKPLIS